MKKTRSDTIEEYKAIQELKKQGYNRHQTVIRTGYTTYKVYKLWDLEEDDATYNYYDEHPLFSQYEQFIIERFKQMPYITVAQLRDMVEKVYGKLPGGVSAWTRFVKVMKKKHGIASVKKPRYARAESPMGLEAQVDMGEMWLTDMYGRSVKVYMFAMVLVYSRMKYVFFSPDPFTTELFCYAHEKAFKYFGGRTKQITYDQDRIIVKSENAGDIIFIKEFDEYKKKVGFDVFLCKKHDPNAKGMIENVIKYVKCNFLKNKEYCGIDSLNSDALAWLDRTGNGQVHHTTREIPRLRFEKESQYLIPTTEVKMCFYAQKILVVSNTYDIKYKTNRYVIPMGVVRTGDKVRVEEVGDMLNVYNPETSELIWTCKILKQQNGVQAIPPMKDIKWLEDYEKLKNKDILFISFLGKIEELYPRYVKEQYYLIKKIISKYGVEKTKEAIKYCMQNNQTYVNDLLTYMLVKEGPHDISDVAPSRSSQYYKDKAVNLTIYDKLYEEEKDE